MKKPWTCHLLKMRPKNPGSRQEMQTQKSRTLRCREVNSVGYLKEISKIASLKMDLRVHVFLKKITLKSKICFKLTPNFWNLHKFRTNNLGPAQIKPQKCSHVPDTLNPFLSAEIDTFSLSFCFPDWGLIKERLYIGRRLGRRNTDPCINTHFCRIQEGRGGGRHSLSIPLFL